MSARQGPIALYAATDDFQVTQRTAAERIARESGQHIDTLIDQIYRSARRQGFQSAELIYRYLAEYLAFELAGDVRLAERKQSLYLYKARYGTLKVIVGIAKGEESRVAKADESGKKPRSKWFAECVERIYPLIDEGMDRSACQAFISECGAAVPPPSNCFMCPFKSPIEILWTAKHDPARFDVWVALEARKLAANAHLNAVPNAKGKIVNQNFGVYKTKTLPAVLAAAKVEFAHMTDADLNDYRMSHGHCVKSAY